MSTWGTTKSQGQLLVSGDIRNLEEITDAMQGCTHVAHLAAFSSVPASVADPNLSAAINLQGALNVLHAAEKLGIQRIVFKYCSHLRGCEPDAGD